MTSSLGTFRINGGLKRYEARTEWIMVALSIMFLVVIILPYAHPLSRTEDQLLRSIDVVVWGIFAVDYLLRLLIAAERTKFITTHLFDLLVVAVPFMRPLRLVRVVSLVVATGRRAGNLVIQQVMIYVLLLAAIIMSTCAVLVYHFEQASSESNIHSLADGFWWAMTTVTTVGYGDRFPVTAEGRVVAVALMITGIALMGSITAAIAAKFVDIIRGKTSTEIALDQTTQSEIIANDVRELKQLVLSLHADVKSLSEPKTGDI